LHVLGAPSQAIGFQPDRTPRTPASEQADEPGHRRGLGYAECQLSRIDIGNCPPQLPGRRVTSTVVSKRIDNPPDSARTSQIT